MSKPNKTKETPDLSKEAIEDAVVVDASDGDATSDSVEISEEPGKQPDLDSSEPVEAEEADSVTGEAEPALDPIDLGDKDTAAEQVMADPEVESAPVEPVPTLAPEKPAPVKLASVKKVGFVPVVLGGVVAACLGAGVALYLFPNGMNGGNAVVFQSEVSAILAAQADRDQQLADQISGLTLPPDLSAEVSGIAEGLSGQTGHLAEVADRVAAFEKRITDLEKRPLTSAVSDDVVAAYERELQALQAAMATQRAEVEKMIATAQAKEDQADLTAQEAALQSALAQVAIAMDTGGSFDAPLAELTAAGIAVPEVLASTVDGVPTLAQLQSEFPTSARAALAAARTEGGNTGAFNFLRTQLGVRSLAPKDGDDPDAVLSRAEAALKAGHLSDVFVELKGLPETGRAELSNWMARATLRSDVLVAVDTLRQSMMN